MSILFYAVLVLAILLLFKFIFSPVKLMFKILLNTVVGAVLILSINWIGSYFGFKIPFNEITSLLVGALGVPGAMLMSAISIF